MPRVETITVKEFSELFGYSRQRVDQLIQEGMPYRNAKSGKEIYPREALKWMIARARSEGKKTGGSDEEHQRIRHLRAQADLKEQEAKLRSGDLVPRKEWATFLEAFIAGFTAAATRELQRFERAMIRVVNAAEARLLNDEIRKSLMEGALRYADQLTAEAEEIEARYRRRRRSTRAPGGVNV